MQEIYILRHGHAQDAVNGLTDFERALTVEGVEKIIRISQFFNATKVKLDLILTSPYLRAKETAEVFQSNLDLKPELKIVDFLACGSSSNEISRGLQSYSLKEKVLFVGHCPDLEMFLGKLIGAGRIPLKKGSLAKVTLEDSLETSGRLEWLITPKLVKNLKPKNKTMI